MNLLCFILAIISLLFLSLDLFQFNMAYKMVLLHGFFSLLLPFFCICDEVFLSTLLFHCPHSGIIAQVSFLLLAFYQVLYYISFLLLSFDGLLAFCFILLLCDFMHISIDHILRLKKMQRYMLKIFWQGKRLFNPKTLENMISKKSYIRPLVIFLQVGVYH